VAERQTAEPALVQNTGKVQTTPSSALPPPIPVIANPAPAPVFSAEKITIPVATLPPAAVPKEKSSLEFKLGSYWLVRIGIVMFLAALVLAGNYAYDNFVRSMGPALKLAILYTVGGLLTGFGLWMERRGEKMLNFSRVLFAGGLSSIYYITYAAHYVPRLRVIESPVLAGALLLAWAAVIAGVADRRKSQTLAVLSVLLAYLSSSITPIAGFTLFSNFVLTSVAVFFFIRHRWAVISWGGLVGTYASFGYWRAFGLVDRGGFETNAESPWLLLAVLFSYWIVFTAATFSRPGREERGPVKVSFLTANNLAFFTYGCLLLTGPEFMKFWQWSMGLGALLLGLSTLAVRLVPLDRTTQNSYFSQGLLLVTVGLITYFEGQSLALVMAMESVFLLVCGTYGKNLISRLGSYVTAAIAILVESVVLLERQDSGMYTGIAVSAFILFNAWWVRQGLAAERRHGDSGPAWLLSAGALWVGFVCTLAHADPDARPFIFAFESLGLGIAFYYLKMREGLALSQAFWLAAFGAWLVLGWEDNHRMATWSHVSVLFTALIWGHAWKWLPLGRSLRTACCFQAAYALGAVCVLAGWILPDRSTEAIVCITAFLAVLLLGYGAVTRAWFLAGVGQIFLWISAGTSLTLSNDPPWNWAVALLPILVLVLLRRSWLMGLSYFGILNPASEVPLRWLARGYEMVALILGWAWINNFVHQDWQIATYLAAGFVLFVAGTIESSSPRSFEDRLLWLFAALFALIGWGVFLYDGWPNLQNALGLLLIPLVESLARRRRSLPEYARIVLVMGGVLGALVFVSRFTALHVGSNYWTVSWGLLAGLVFAAGFFLKHHWYRWAGLALLALAIGRVGLVDIWRFETGYRIISLFVLSGMAIGLGFLYTRYQEKMKEWL